MNKDRLYRSILVDAIHEHLLDDLHRLLRFLHKTGEHGWRLRKPKVGCRPSSPTLADFVHVRVGTYQPKKTQSRAALHRPNRGILPWYESSVEP